ncbi:MAG TPA: DinB family protein [Bryobacteraceae bacterium]|jgi:uncharacterized damage-inducible protein DinB|nr:DinB family protein [Bryobacteraceae bacterium]
MISIHLVLFAVSAGVLHAQPSVLGEARQEFDEVRSFILRSAEKMPEESYSFKPAPRVRTFGQILGHIAEEQYLFCGTAKGEQRAADVEGTKTSKADLIAALREAFAYCDSVYDSLNDATALQVIGSGAKTRTRLKVLWGNTIQDNLHYGNLITYLRIKGLVPPSTEGQ